MTERIIRVAAGLLAVASAVVLSSVPARAFSLRVIGSSSGPRMVFDHRMKVTSVCLPVTNPAGGQSLLYGQRFSDGPVYPWTPAIVLVHGIASSTLNWDFVPTWSVARALASAGYLVFSYDRLGYARSSYFDHPGGGTTLTTAAHRAMLHDVISDVRTGSYGVAATADCSRPTTPGDTRSAASAIIGHSAGGWIVAGYPGQYHDVAAMIQTDISGSAGGAPSASSPLGSSSGGGFNPDPNHPDYFQFFQTTQNCLDFNTYSAGVVPSVARVACAPPFLDSPYGEIADLGAMYAQNDANIAMIGPSIPVLLTSGEQDTTDPPSSADADYAYYRAHCGCQVTQLLVRDTAHLFMVHRSLPSWLDYVVNWLTARGVPGTPVMPGTAGCPAPSGRLKGRSLGPLRLGWTRARARKALRRFRVVRPNIEAFCLSGGSGIRVGYASPKLTRTLTRHLGRGVAGRVVLALTANPYYTLAGARPGRRVADAASRLRPGRPFHIGQNYWYVLSGKASSRLLKVRAGVILAVGIADQRLSRSRAATLRLLRSFSSL